jgi:hypothetical protein
VASFENGIGSHRYNEGLAGFAYGGARRSHMISF